MSDHPSSVWPEGQEYLRSIVCAAYLVSLCAMSVIFTSRMGNWRSARRLPVMQLLVLTLLGCSLLFLFISAIILLGVGSSFTAASCSAGIWLCVILYALTKAVLYVLLLEKLHIVHCHSAMGKVPRYKSWWYRGGFFLLLAWVGVAIAMIIGRIALIRQKDGMCIIGVRFYATVPMLTVDAITNIYLTCGFIIPIWKSAFPKAQRLARVSAIAAVAALVTSFGNILILTLQHGHQLSFVCLGACGLDVMFNSIIVYFVTTANRQRDEATTTAGSNMGEPISLKGRTSRNASLFPGSTANPFHPTASSATHGVGVTIVEEVRVEEDHDMPMPPMRRPSQRPLVAPMTISFKEPRMDDIDSDEEADLEDKTPASEKPTAADYLPKQL
ncbi:hypothetical protein JCM6882_002354 [Rhodosporidiobolus microsporus]